MQSLTTLLAIFFTLVSQPVSKDEPLTKVMGPEVLIINASNNDKEYKLRIIIDENGRYQQTGTGRIGDQTFEMSESGVMVRQGPDLLKIFDSDIGGQMRWHITEETDQTYTVEKLIGIENVVIRREKRPEQ